MVAHNLKRHILEGSRIYLSRTEARQGSKKRSGGSVTRRPQTEEPHRRRSETTRADNARLRREQRGSRSILAPSDPIPRVPIRAGKCSTETIPRNSQTSTPTRSTQAANPCAAYRRVADSITSGATRRGRRGDDARKREMLLHGKRKGPGCVGVRLP